MRKFHPIFLLPLILSCSDDASTNETNDMVIPPARNLGVQIDMIGPRGSLYVDSTEKVYAFRSYEGTIKNDTTIPIEVHIDIPNTWTILKPNQGQKYIRFLLPDSMTSQKQYDFALDNRHVSPQLNNLINTKLDLLTTRSLMIQPNETFCFRLGFLVFPADGLFRADLYSQAGDSLKNENVQTLRLYTTMSSLWSETLIGHFTFMSK
jgi:hypothetical protein